MPTSRSLTLIAPHIGPALIRARKQQEVRWPTLARLAGRGAIRCLMGDALPASAGAPPDPGRPAPPGRFVQSDTRNSQQDSKMRGGRDARRPGALAPWQDALLAILGLDQEAAAFPSAAVTRTGDIGEPAEGFWMHACPMHFAAGMEHVSATLLRTDNRLVHAECAELASMLAEHLRLSGFELVSARDGAWLVRSAQAMQFETVEPNRAATGPLAQAMPQGRDAAALRRLMTELQMLLHEHPVNAQRERRGVPAANAIWFHGEGALAGTVSAAAAASGTESSPGQWPQAFGRDLFLRGIYRLLGATVNDVPADAASLLPQLTGKAVAILDTEDLDTLESLWLAPLARMLMRGRLAYLGLVLDHWCVQVRPASCLALWRSPRSPMDWPMDRPRDRPRDRPMDKPRDLGHPC